MMALEFDTIDILFALAFAIGATSLFALWHLQKRRLYFYWRLAAVMLLLFLLLHPVIVKYSGDRRPLLAIAVDTSPSMVMTGRFKSAQAFLAEHIDALSSRFKIKQYGFSASAIPQKKIVSLDQKKEKEVFAGESTDIHRSLWEIRRENGESLAGILVLSDGNHNATTLSPEWVEELNVPLFPIVLENIGGMTDVSIDSVRVSDFAFKDTPLKIVADLSAFGCKGKAVTVNVRNASMPGVIVATALVPIGTDNEKNEVVLNIIPRASGSYEYSVEALPLKNELTRENNRKKFTLNVLHEKIRVLFICGQPGPEYSFLRHTLKNDPSVELVSFVILRNPENITLVSDEDLALIPFPVNTIFTKDLFDFDVLILENFTYERFGFLPEYLANIRRWVIEKGGGLVMIGGVNSFGKGRWALSPVAEALPVVMDAPDTPLETGLFKPRAENLSHQIMRLVPDEAENRTIWDSLPSLEGCHTLEAKKNATVLLRHPWKNWAVLTCWDAGKGRAVTLGNNTTWRWSLQSPTPERYITFWKNIIRYLSRSELFDGWNLLFDRPEYFSDQGFEVRVFAGSAVTVSEPRLSITGPTGEEKNLQLTKKSEKEWMASGTFAVAGKYHLHLLITEGGVFAEKKSIMQEVKPSLAREKMNLHLHTGLLKNMADASQGQLFSADTFSIDAIMGKARNVKKTSVRDAVPVWSHNAWLALLFLLLVSEWYYRRRNGLW